MVDVGSLIVQIVCSSHIEGTSIEGVGVGDLLSAPNSVSSHHHTVAICSTIWSVNVGSYIKKKRKIRLKDILSNEKVIRQSKIKKKN
jgi:hypothetical protein